MIFFKWQRATGRTSDDVGHVIGVEFVVWNAVFF